MTLSGTPQVGFEAPERSCCAKLLSENIQERLGASKNVQEPPGASRSVQERPGASRSVQEHPGASRSVQKPPRASRSVQDHPGAPPAHHHPILTRPSPNLPQILTLPSHLHSAPLTPQPNTYHHLPTPSPSKTTATSQQRQHLDDKNRQNSYATTHTQLFVDKCNQTPDPLLDPPRGWPQNWGQFPDPKQTPEKMSPHSGGTYFRGSVLGPENGPDLGAAFQGLVVEISQ